MVSMELDDGVSPTGIAYSASAAIGKAYATSKRHVEGASREALPPTLPPPPPKGPGGGSDDDGNARAYDGGMEQRVAALENFASDAKDKLARIETKVDALATKSELESIRSDFLKTTNETKNWMITTIIGLFLGFGGLFFTMSNFLKPSGAPAQPAQAPIIINVPPSQPALGPAPLTNPAK